MQSKSSAGKPQTDMESKIVDGLGRVSQALRTLLWDVAKEEGLSPIQVQFLIYLYRHSKERGRISNLAQESGLTQATVSDAVRVLMEKGLIYKKTSDSDGRVFNLNLTSSGKRLAFKLSDWQRAIKSCLNKFSTEKKEYMAGFLMELIAQLQRAGIIRVARMCITCSFFQKDVHTGSKKPHHCGFTDTPLGEFELNLDCDQHQLKPK